MVTGKIIKEPTILFVPKTRRRKRRWLGIILFMLAIAALIVFLFMLANDRAVPFSFF